MPQRLKILTIYFILVAFMVSGLATNVYAGPEADLLLATLNKLKTLGTAISQKWELDGGGPGSPVYPESSGNPCQSSQGTGAPCWTYDIVSNDPYSDKMMDDLGHPGENLLINPGGG